MLPAILSIGTLVILVALSYFKPVWVAYFLIAFDVYWLLQVIYMALYLISSYRKVQQNVHVDWRSGRLALDTDTSLFPADCLAKQGLKYTDLRQLIILPTYNEDLEIVRSALNLYFR